jgi:hypothetical protein
MMRANYSSLGSASLRQLDTNARRPRYRAQSCNRLLIIGQTQTYTQAENAV